MSYITFRGDPEVISKTMKDITPARNPKQHIFGGCCRSLARGTGSRGLEMAAKCLQEARFSGPGDHSVDPFGPFLMIYGQTNYLRLF